MRILTETLKWAVGNNNVEIVKNLLLLAESERTVEFIREIRLIVIDALSRGNIEIIKCLLNFDSTIDLTIFDRLHPNLITKEFIQELGERIPTGMRSAILSNAVYKDNLDVIKLFVGERHLIRSNIAAIVLHSSKEAIELLFDDTMEFEKYEKYGLGFARYCIETKGMNPTDYLLKNVRGFGLAQKNAITEYLLSKGADIHVNDDEIVFDSVIHEDYVFARWLIEKGANVHARSHTRYYNVPKWCKDIPQYFVKLIEFGILPTQECMLVTNVQCALENPDKEVLELCEKLVEVGLGHLLENSPRLNSKHVETLKSRGVFCVTDFVSRSAGFALRRCEKLPMFDSSTPAAKLFLSITSGYPQKAINKIVAENGTVNHIKQLLEMYPDAVINYEKVLRLATDEEDIETIKFVVEKNLPSAELIHQCLLISVEKDNVDCVKYFVEIGGRAREAFRYAFVKTSKNVVAYFSKKRRVLHIKGLKFCSKKDDCCVCYDPKKTYKTPCGHGCCVECWSRMIHDTYVDGYTVQCPMCRADYIISDFKLIKKISLVYDFPQSTYSDEHSESE